MSSAFSSRQDAPSRTWWSLSKPSEKDLRQTYSSDKPSKSSSGFSFASVIGFKSKKHPPSLAIQHPHLQGPPALSPSLTVDTPDPPTKFLNRLPSKSVSSTRSRDDSIAPRTPSDIHRDGRQSLLTLSDLDPFAGRTMVSLGSVHTISDPNHLSVYSNTSVSEFVQKHLNATQMPKQDRVSYASSSSNSQYLSNDASPTSLSPLAVDGDLQKKLSTKTSCVSLYRKALFVAPEGHDDPKTELLPSNSPMDKKQLTSSPRSVMRARGNTSDGSGQRAGFFVGTNPSQPRPSGSGSASSRRPSSASQQRPASAPRPSSASRTASTSRSSSTSRPSSSQKRSSSSQPAPLPTSPRVVIRQSSTSHISLPPSAPPTHELPATPAVVVDEESRSDFSGFLPCAESASSSTLSFASSLSSTRETLTQQRPRSKSTRASERDLFFQNPKEGDPDSASLHSISRVTQTLNTSTRTLREVISHQSLRRRAQPSPSTESHPAFDTTNEKVPRKRRSFHHPRLPMPPIPLPLRHASSYNSSMSSPTADTSPMTSEQGRGNASSSSGGRKRLFSSNRRPSTSQCFPSEDDTQSIFSVRSDQETSTGTSFKPWIAARASSQSSFWEEGASDVATSFVRAEYTPQHIMSPAEIAEVEASVENTPSLYTRQRGFSLLSATSEADHNDTPSGLSPPPPMRLKAKQSDHRTRNKPITAKSSAPPRHDYRPSTTHPVISPLSVSSDEDEEPIYRPSSSPPPSMTSLPPPPRPRQRGTLVSQPDLSVNSPPLPPPARKGLMRSNTSVEKMIHRRSIMRKPSFLEIDDDTDKDTDVEIADASVSGSFLDLARESFDTVRSGQ